MTQFNFSALLPLLFLAIAQSHLTLLLKDGKIFDPWFDLHSWLKELRSCPICIGWWTALTISVFAGIRNPWQTLAIAGIGHVLFLLREKYLPCDKCKVLEPIPFKIIGI